MKFHIRRCLGILSLGVAAFFVAIMPSSFYSWDVAFHHVLDYYPTIFYGYILGLIGATALLSIEKSEEKS